MNRFVIGGTGVLGRGLLRQLRERGHHVFTLARNSENEHASGKRAVDFLTASTRTTNTRFHQATGWMPRNPHYR